MHRLEHFLPSDPVNRAVALLAVVLLPLVAGGLVVLVMAAGLWDWAWAVALGAASTLAIALLLARAILSRWFGALEQERQAANDVLSIRTKQLQVTLDNEQPKPRERPRD